MNSISCRAKEDQRPRKFPATLDRPIDGAIREATSSGCTRSGSRGGDDAMGQGAAPRVEQFSDFIFCSEAEGMSGFLFTCQIPGDNRQTIEREDPRANQDPGCTS